LRDPEDPAACVSGYHARVAQRTLVIVNPRSHDGATGRRFSGVERQLRALLGPIEVEHTRGPRDAERIAREGVRSGVERVLVAGGDGTLGEVVTGLLAADLGAYAQLGLLPLGTGSDFVRSVGSPRRIEDAVACIASGRARPVDAGRVQYVDEDGKDCVRYFANVASFGISGLVDEIVERTTRRLGGGAAFLIGALRALLRYRSERVEIRVDGEPVFDGPLVLGTGANGRYFGGGMQVAPEARIDDGLLDVVVVPALPWPRLLAKLPMIYRGAHLHDAAVTHHRGRVIEALAEPGLVKLELDGEPIGTLPARCEVLPGALSVIGPL
jgi:YegS/Rv2252/BmrU family lipid kinase